MSCSSIFAPIFSALPNPHQPTIAENWTLTPVHPHVYHATCADHPPIAVKYHPNAKREFAVLHALRDFGINIAPEPLAHDNEILITNWVTGEPLTQPPDTDDSEAWHRMMAVLGASGDMHYADYTAQVPMMGSAYQNPGDMMDEIERMLADVDANDPVYETLTALTERLREQIPPTWNTAPQIGLCRSHPHLHDLIYEGNHLLALDWANADWGDMAAEIGLWSSQPAFETVPTGHWVWFRWEFARLTKDNDLVSRATTYARMGQVWWAVKLSSQQNIRDRYISRAQKIFRT